MGEIPRVFESSENTHEKSSIMARLAGRQPRIHKKRDTEAVCGGKQPNDYVCVSALRYTVCYVKAKPHGENVPQKIQRVIVGVGRHQGPGILLGHIYRPVVVDLQANLAQVRRAPTTEHAQCSGRYEREDKKDRDYYSAGKKKQSECSAFIRVPQASEVDFPSAPRTLSLRPRWATKRFLCRPSVTLST